MKARVGADLTEAFTALDGRDRFEARAKIVAMMEARGLLGKIEPNSIWCHTATARMSCSSRV